MKKLLGIVVLGLLLSGNAYAKDLNLTCDMISAHNHYGTKVTTLSKSELLSTGWPTFKISFIVNSKKKKILRQKLSGEFAPMGKNANNFDIVWSDYNIIWTWNVTKDEWRKHILNRSTGEYEEISFYGEKSMFRKQAGLTKQVNKFQCIVSEKLF